MLATVICRILVLKCVTLCDPGRTCGLRAREPLPLCVGLSSPSVLDSVTFLCALGACEGRACDLEVC